MYDEEITPILIDNGTYSIKSGFGGDDAPRAVYPSIVGDLNSNAPLFHHQQMSMSYIKNYVGDEVESKYAILDIHPVFSQGHVINFDRYERLLHHNFYNELSIAPEEHPIASLETTGTEAKERMKKTEIIFEVFSVPSFFIENDNVSALYASGKDTGVILNVGEEHSSCTPIYERQILSHAVTFGSVGGKQINDYISCLIKDELNQSTTFKRNLIYRDIKEKNTYVPLEYEKEIQKENSKDYLLPDGRSIKLDTKSLMAPELLFQPQLFNIKDISIDNMINTSITNSYSLLQNEFISNIVLSGGSTMFPGIHERLISCLEKEFYNKVKIFLPPERKYSAWIGLSIFTTTYKFSKFGMSRDDYEEYGTNFIEMIFPSSYSKYQNHHKSFKPNFKIILDRFKGDFLFHFEN